MSGATFTACDASSALSRASLTLVRRVVSRSATGLTSSGLRTSSSWRSARRSAASERSSGSWMRGEGLEVDHAVGGSDRVHVGLASSIGCGVGEVGARRRHRRDRPRLLGHARHHEGGAHPPRPQRGLGRVERVGGGEQVGAGGVGVVADLVDAAGGEVDGPVDVALGLEGRDEADDRAEPGEQHGHSDGDPRGPLDRLRGSSEADEQHRDGGDGHRAGAGAGGERASRRTPSGPMAAAAAMAAIGGVASPAATSPR